MIARIPKSRIRINLAILLFLSAGLNGCLGSSDGVDVDEERVPIVLALDRIWKVQVAFLMTRFFQPSSLPRDSP